MSGENCLNFNCYRATRATPGISFLGVPTKDDLYCTNWRNKTVAVITRNTVMKAI